MTFGRSLLQVLVILPSQHRMDAPQQEAIPRTGSKLVFRAGNVYASRTCGGSPCKVETSIYKKQPPSILLIVSSSFHSKTKRSQFHRSQSRNKSTCSPLLYPSFLHSSPLSPRLLRHQSQPAKCSMSHSNSTERPVPRFPYQFLQTTSHTRSVSLALSPRCGPHRQPVFLHPHP